MDEVNAHCRKIGRKIAWDFGGSHIKVREAGPMTSILAHDGCPLSIPNTPSDWRWVYNARAEFRKVGLLPIPVPKPPKPMTRGATISLPDRVGRALRRDLPPATRRALLREIAELADLAAEAKNGRAA